MRKSHSEKDAFVQKIITYPGKANSSGKASSCCVSGRSQFRSHNNLNEFGANCSGFHAARADILSRMGRLKESAGAYQRALALAANQMEREFPARRLKTLECELDGGSSRVAAMAESRVDFRRAMRRALSQGSKPCIHVRTPAADRGTQAVEL